MTNYNIELQCIGLILVILLVFFSAARRSLGLITEKAYRVLLGTVAVSICLDIASIITINRADLGLFPQDANILVCKTYIVSLTLVALAVFFYALTEIYSGAVLKQKILMGYILIEILTIAGVYFFPLEYYLDEHSIYSFGLSTDVGAGIGLVYLLLSEVYLILYRKQTDKGRRRAIQLFCFAMIAAAAFQNFNRKYLFASLTIGICMIFIYMALEDPNSYTDRLTGVLNQSVLKEYLKSQVSQGHKVSIINVRLNDYRRLKDLYGDEFFSKLTVELVSYFERYPYAKVFSSGGADFAVALRKDENLKDYVAKIRKDFSIPWHVERADVELQISVVVYPGSQMGDSADEIYRSLRYFVDGLSGEGEEETLIIGEEELGRLSADDRIQKLLAGALTENRMEIYYKPVMRAETERICAAEAMARLSGETGEVLLDSELLSAAEKNGIILKLGVRIFEEVCRFLRDTDIEKLGVEKIIVSLTAAQCMQRTLADDLIEIMHNYGVDGFMFIFEVADEAIRYGREILRVNLEKLIASGAKVSMDRYGRNQSSIIDVLEMPVDTIKMDRSLVKRCFKEEGGGFSEEGEIILNTLKQLGKKIVASGIDTEEELKWMKEAGVDYLQGRQICDAVDEVAFVAECRKRMGKA
ncbi:MAG: EAL domain-containing protein [Lachnospiraceae bacterium]|nr:EAL domain-containing protein [Lachnospiraceae bacterium]